MEQELFEAWKSIRVRCHSKVVWDDPIDFDLKTIENALEQAQMQKNVLEVIREKCLYTDNLNDVATCLNYDYYKERKSKEHDTKIVKIDWNDRYLLDALKLLNQEEFNLLKTWQERFVVKE